VQPFSEEDVLHCAVRGQYGPGVVNGERMSGYRQEDGVPPDSKTETFVALRLMIDNWRWAGVPFYLRTGKRLPTRVTEVAVHFKRAPLMLFRDTPVQSLGENVLVIRIQPNEGISLCFNAKVPGPFERLETVTMDFSYAQYFKAEPTTGYETLLFDAMTGDQTLFHRMDMVEAGWQVVAPILEAWKKDAPSHVPAYSPGTWGPAEADLVIERDGREWRN